MTRATCILIVVTVAGLALTGCARAAGEAFEAFRGAKGIYVPIVPVAETKEARPLGQYTRFELGEIQDAFGGSVPPELFRQLPAKFAEEIEKAKLPNDPSGKTLLVRGKIYHYEDEGLVGMMLGPLEEVVARIELVDKDSGRVIGVANCIGRTTKAAGKGVPKKAEGLARAIVSWIKSGYPEPEK